LLQKNVPYDWNEKAEAAFVTLKTLLTTEHLLQYSDFTRPFVLTTYASNDAIGAVLSHGPIGKDLPIAYASRTLINAEKNYPTIEKELLAIVWSCISDSIFMDENLLLWQTADHSPGLLVLKIPDPDF